MTDALPWTVARLIESMRAFFAARGIESARLDAEVLLAHVLGQSRMYLYTHYDQPVTDAEREALRALARRRAAHEPVAYLLGQQEFYGHTLSVDRHVLIPRPETEGVVDLALAYARGPLADRESLSVLDIGTGSGAIAIALAAADARLRVQALDRSPEALAVAARNAERLGVGERVSCVEADMATLSADACPQAIQRAAPFDLIVSNPPYIGEDERASLMADVRDFEPAAALFAPEDGRQAIRWVRAAAARHLATPGLLVVEVAPRHAGWLRGLAPAGANEQQGLERDLAGHERFWLQHRGPWQRRGAPAVAGGLESQVEAAELARD